MICLPLVVIVGGANKIDQDRKSTKCGYTLSIKRGGQEMISYNICSSYNKLSIVTLGSITDSQLVENIASFILQDGATK